MRPILLIACALVLKLAAADDATRANRPSDPGSISEVRMELETMFDTDQLYRVKIIELERSHGSDSPEVKEAWTKQAAEDAHNIGRLEEIIAVHGWPGRTQFGWKASAAAFAILQHADLSMQKKYLPIARTAAAKREMEASALALLEDRICVREGRKQIYGSQVQRTESGDWEPLEVEDEDHLDGLRAKVGLEPISVYLQGFADRSGGQVSPKWRITKRKAAQPGATDNPDDAQRCREDH